MYPYSPYTHISYLRFMQNEDYINYENIEERSALEMRTRACMQWYEVGHDGCEQCYQEGRYISQGIEGHHKNPADIALSVVLLVTILTGSDM